MTSNQNSAFPLIAFLGALAAILLGALVWIAPVWQPGFVPAAQRNASVATPPQEETAYINVNTATAEELTALPGIGAARAAAILAWREEYGPFAALDDLAQISGISANMVESWRGLADVK